MHKKNLLALCKKDISLTSEKNKKLKLKLRTKLGSISLVYKCLLSGERLTVYEIHERTKIPPRTIRYALRELIDAYIITEYIYLPDLRRKFYGLAQEHHIHQ